MMKKVKIFLIGISAFTLLGISSALAQNYPDATDGGRYVQVAKDADKVDNTYITVGKTLPYYVAPGELTHPNWDRVSVETPQDVNGGALAFTSTWTWLSGTAGVVTLGTPAGNKVDITADAVGSTLITVKESPQPGSPLTGCTDSKESTFTVHAVGHPTIGFDKTTSTLGSSPVLALPYKKPGGTLDQIVTDLDGQEVLFVTTCDPSAVSTAMSLNLLSEEEGLDVDALKTYAFQLMSYSYSIGSSGSSTVLNAPTVVEDHPTSGKLQIVGTAATTITPSVAAPTGGARMNEYIYYLEKPSDVAATAASGVVSAISHRSDNALIPTSTYAFAANNTMVRALVIRVIDKPETGPIYHIPNGVYK